MKLLAVGLQIENLTIFDEGTDYDLSAADDSSSDNASLVSLYAGGMRLLGLIPSMGSVIANDEGIDYTVETADNDFLSYVDAGNMKLLGVDY